MEKEARVACLRLLKCTECLSAICQALALGFLLSAIVNKECWLEAEGFDVDRELAANRTFDTVTVPASRRLRCIVLVCWRRSKKQRFRREGGLRDAVDGKDKD